MKTKLVPSAWIEKEGRRLDCGPYLSGAIEAKLLLEKLSVPKEPLHKLTTGHDGGIYNGPQFVRNYVDDPAYGVPFLTSSSMLLADLSKADLLRKRDALSPRLAFLRLKPGMTLISCSGTVGRMVYARPDMDGVWSSQDVLKVVPDESKILSGYLYAFLAGRYGVPMIVGGTYGAIIQHIEPEHIWHLPVPRLSPALEESTHNLVRSAGEKRATSRRIVAAAIEGFYKTFGLTSPQSLKNPMRFAAFTTHSSRLGRLDAHFHAPACQQATEALENCCVSSQKLNEIARVFTPGIFKRIRVEDPQYGYPYYSGSELFEIVPQPRGFLSKKSFNIEDYIVRENWLLIQDAGQLGGLIGQITRVRPGGNCSVVSNHLMRVVPHDSRDTGYVYLVLHSQHGHFATLRHAFGTSIPQLDPSKVGEGVGIPWPAAELRWQLAEPILESWRLIDEADQMENQAIAGIEEHIEEGH